MFAITGITGNVGGKVAKNLLLANHPVRAVLRDLGKAAPWQKLGCPISQADMNDPAALTAAFQGADGVFILLPPIFDPSPGCPEMKSVIAAVRHALEAARPKKVVCLSTIGAQTAHTNLLTQLSMMEQSFSELPLPVTFLRPAWFMENFAWDVDSAKTKGLIPSFLQPLDKPFPMVATTDVASAAAHLLQQNWTGRQILELEGPQRITPHQVAHTFTQLLAKPVRIEPVPRETWEELFKSQGMKNPTPRIQMLDGFNQGWIEFENGQPGSQKGTVPLKAGLKNLIEPHTY
jgi:uncharacterized protein YbjT (DUF2867 family)